MFHLCGSSKQLYNAESYVYASNNKTERIVTFLWQQLLRKRSASFIKALHAVGSVKMRVELHSKSIPVSLDSSRDILKGMATSYGPDGPRFESQ
jgi:hypothetical protein